MNQQLQGFARQYLKDGLAKLPGRPQEIFKLMYARDNGKRSVYEALAMPINDVVDAMPQDRLDHAMKQVERTLSDMASNAIGQGSAACGASPAPEGYTS